MSRTRSVHETDGRVMPMREDIDLANKLLKFHDRITKPGATMADADQFAAELSAEVKRAA